MSQVVGLPSNSHKHIISTAWVRALLCKLQKGCTRLTSDQVYQLLAHGWWFSPGTPAYSTTKTGRHDIAEILLKVALNTKKSKSKPLSPRVRQIKYYEISVRWFSARHPELMRKSKYWLVRNWDYVSEWSDMSTHRLLFQPAAIIKKTPQTKLVDLVQSGHHHHHHHHHYFIECNLFSP